MSGIGSMELLVISLVSLIVFGPEKTKNVIKMFGKVLRTIKKYIEDICESMNESNEVADIKKTIDKLKDDPVIKDEMTEIQQNILETNSLIRRKK